MSPWRTLNVAMDFFARRTLGAWPVMRVRRSMMRSRRFWSFAFPVPVETTSLRTFGACMTFSQWRSPFSASNTFLCVVVVAFIGLFELLAAFNGNALTHSVGAASYLDARRLAGFRVHYHHVRYVNG